MLATFIKVALSFISGNWTKAAQLIVDWHKSTLDATATHEKTEADLASRDLELQGKEREVNAQLQAKQQAMPGGWLLIAPMGIIEWSVAIYLGKLLLIDKTARPFVMYFADCPNGQATGTCDALDRLMTTDPLGVDLWSTVVTVVGFYFGRALIGVGASVATSIAATIRSRKI